MSVIEHPDRRCLFVSKEETSIDSEVLNEYDDMEIVVCEDTRDVVVETRTSTAKLCQEHAEHCVETGKWEFVDDDPGNEPEPTQTTLVTDGGTEDDIELICPNCGDVFTVPGHTTVAADGSFRPCSWRCRRSVDTGTDQSENANVPETEEQ